MAEMRNQFILEKLKKNNIVTPSFSAYTDSWKSDRVIFLSFAIWRNHKFKSGRAAVRDSLDPLSAACPPGNLFVDSCDDVTRARETSMVHK